MTPYSELVEIQCSKEEPEYVDAPREEDPNGTILGSALPTGYYLPIFDLDFECSLLPSRTPGHSHLYINRPISMDKYSKILDALEDAGLVQKAWVNRLHTHQTTYLRLPADRASLPDWAPKSRYKDPELDTTEQKSGTMLSD